MKKLKNVCIVMLLCFIAGICFAGVKSSAKTIIPVKEGKVIRADIDRDGKKERVEYTWGHSNNTGYNYGHLYINGKLIRTKKEAALKLIKCGKQYFVNFESVREEYGAIFKDKEYDRCFLYYLTKKHKLVQIIDMRRIFEAHIIYADSKTILVEEAKCTRTTHNISWLAKYKVNGKKVTFQKRGYKILRSQMKKNTYITAKALKFTKAYKGKSKFTVPKNKKVKLLSIIYDKKEEAIYGKFRYGKKYGYFNLDEWKIENIFKNIDFYGDEYF